MQTRFYAAELRLARARLEQLGVAWVAAHRAVICVAWIAACSPTASSAAADYPVGPYGVAEGDTIANLAFAHLDGRRLALGGMYHGEKRALVLYATGTWCFSCKPEVAWLNGKIASGDSDVLPLAVVLEDNRYQRADAPTARRWADSLEVKFETVVDPSGALDSFRTSGVVPMNLVIDTRTMRIVYRQYEFDPKALDAALAKLTKDATP